MKLGPRLAALASCVPQDAVVADIGTDHAYLPIALVTAGQVRAAIAGDVVPGPFQAAQRAVAAAGCEQQVSVRLGNGLAVLEAGEADTIVIAGMGGPTIIEILTAEPAVVAQTKRLVLQPMIAAGAVRRWLVAEGWRLVDERLIEDSGRVYEVIVAEPGTAMPQEDVLYEIGPLNWERRDPLLGRLLADQIRQLRGVIRQMEMSPTAMRDEKYAVCRARLQALEAKQACL